MTGNRIADKITSAGKSKEDDKTKKNTRNLISTREKTTNNWWIDIV